MAFDKDALKAEFVTIFSNPQIINNVEVVAEAMANAIDEYVKTGKATGADSNGDTHNLTLQ